MSTNPRNIRLVVGEIRESLDKHSREELVEILTYVFKEYVVEGGAPLSAGANAALDARAELEGLSFAQVVTWLQHHLDLPELQQLEVVGAAVSVRAGGRAHLIEAPRIEPLPPPPIAAPAPTPMPLTPTPPVATTPPAAAATPAPAPAAAQPAKTEEPAGEATDSRFSRLEVD